jgi:hypothetical protein
MLVTHGAEVSDLHVVMSSDMTQRRHLCESETERASGESRQRREACPRGPRQNPNLIIFWRVVLKFEKPPPGVGGRGGGMGGRAMGRARGVGSEVDPQLAAQ